MKKLLIIAIAFLTVQTYAQVFDMVVDPNGEGTFKTIKSAIGRIPTSREGQFLIFIANGTYNEKISLSYSNISFIGESAEGVIITNGDHANDGTHGTSDSYTVWIDADGFYGENLTIENSAGNVGQAVALKTDGLEQVFKNCRLLGFQDTYYAHSGMTYLTESWVEGATDFVFGDATTVFDNSTVNCVKGGQYVTAPADSKLTSTRGDGTTQIHGLLFNNCEVTAESDVPANSYYLGRPWQQYASTVYMNCTLGDHIRSQGWDIMGSEGTWETSFFAEYKSVGTDGNLVDTTGRVDWSYQLSDDYATDYYNLEYFLTKDGTSWDPKPVAVALDAPQNLDGTVFSLTWDEVSGAKGYAIIRNDKVIGFSEANSYADESADGSQANVYYVKSVNTNGNLSDVSNSYTVAASGLSDLTADKELFKIINNRIELTEERVTIKVLSLEGKCLAQYMNESSIELSSFNSGLYIVQARDTNNNLFTKKIIIQ